MTITVLVAGVLRCLLPSPGFPATMPALQMTLVDAEDDRPVAGAHVLFHAGAREGTFTGHGGRHATLFVVETVTAGLFSPASS